MTTEPRRPGDGPPPWVPCVCPACAWYRLPDGERDHSPLSFPTCEGYTPAVTT